MSKQDFVPGLRLAITFLHERAKEMCDPDPKVRQILDSAAFSLGVIKARGGFILNDETSRREAEASATIASLREKVEGLERHIKLHAGDTLSLDNEVRVMKSHWDDAEERATTAEALVAQLQAEGERKRQNTLREAAKIVRARADFSLARKEAPRRPLWHHFANSCADTLEQIAALTNGGTEP